MNKLITIFIALALVSTSMAMAAGVAREDTSWNIGKSGQSIYIKDTSGIPKKLIGVNTSGTEVLIDADGIGTTYGGVIDLGGSQLDTSTEVSPNSYTGTGNYYINITVDLNGTPTTARVLIYIP